MQIAKRSMNWLPRASLFNEAEAARLKRKAYAQDDIAKGQSVASGLIGVENTGEQINLTLRIAANRIQTQAQEKRKKLADSIDFSS